MAAEFDAAAGFIDDILASGELKSHAAKLTEGKMLVDGATVADRRVLQTFNGSIGKTITGGLNSGRTDLRIDKVHEDRIDAYRVGVAGGAPERTITIDDLSPTERYRRLGPEADPATDVLRGVLAYLSGAKGPARKYFMRSETELGKQLLEKVNAVSGSPSG